MRGKFMDFRPAGGRTFTGIVATLGAQFVWENGAHYAFFKHLGHRR
jgi:C4-dicarboxylate transporter DctQ subunit